MPLEVADGQELSDLLTGRDAILTVDGALTLANSAEVTAMFMGVEADTLILNAADKSYAQSGGFLALANAGNAWMFRGGRLDLENMTVFMENGGGANTRFGAANGQIVGGGMTGRFVNVVFTARAAVNFNFGAESLASAIEELGNTYRAGFVHQRRSGLIFVGVNFEGGFAGGGNESQYGYRIVGEREAAARTGGTTFFIECNIGGGQPAGASGVLIQCNPRGSGPAFEQDIVFINCPPVGAQPTSWRSGFRANAKAGAATMRICQGWNPKFYSLADNAAIADAVLLPPPAKVIYAKPAAFDSSVHLSALPAGESFNAPADGLLIEDAFVRQVFAGGAAAAGGLVDAVVEDTSFRVFSYSAEMRDADGVADTITSDADSMNSAGGGFVTEHALNYPVSERGAGLSLAKARRYADNAGVLIPPLQWQVVGGKHGFESGNLPAGDIRNVLPFAAPHSEVNAVVGVERVRVLGVSISGASGFGVIYLEVKAGFVPPAEIAGTLGGVAFVAAHSVLAGANVYTTSQAVFSEALPFDESGGGVEFKITTAGWRLEFVAAPVLEVTTLDHLAAKIAAADYDERELTSDIKSASRETITAGGTLPLGGVARGAIFDTVDATGYSLRGVIKINARGGVIVPAPGTAAAPGIDGGADGERIVIACRVSLDPAGVFNSPGVYYFRNADLRNADIRRSALAPAASANPQVFAENCLLPAVLPVGISFPQTFIYNGVGRLAAYKAGAAEPFAESTTGALALDTATHDIAINAAFSIVHTRAGYVENITEHTMDGSVVDGVLPRDLAASAAPLVAGVSFVPDDDVVWDGVNKRLTYTFSNLTAEPDVAIGSNKLLSAGKGTAGYNRFFWWWSGLTTEQKDGLARPIYFPDVLGDKVFVWNNAAGQGLRVKPKTINDITSYITFDGVTIYGGGNANGDNMEVLVQIVGFGNAGYIGLLMRWSHAASAAGIQRAVSAAAIEGEVVVAMRQFFTDAPYATAADIAAIESGGGGGGLTAEETTAAARAAIDAYYVANPPAAGATQEQRTAAAAAALAAYFAANPPAAGATQQNRIDAAAAAVAAYFRANPIHGGATQGEVALTLAQYFAANPPAAAGATPAQVRAQITAYFAANPIPAAGGGASAADVAAAVFAKQIAGISVAELLRVKAAVLSGRTETAGGVIKFYDAENVLAVSAEVTADGERTSVTLHAAPPAAD